MKLVTDKASKCAVYVAKRSRRRKGIKGTGESGGERRRRMVMS